ncbi:MAG: hypothetical protein JW776_16525 [Candidatus Lokiarchaeota archaeon]|nr:hypothetical protein [Candidatus Lokiarchaeota archaeon]
MMCRVCHKCKEFVKIEDESFEGMRRVQRFELEHSGHPVGTAEITELGEYHNVDNKF